MERPVATATACARELAETADDHVRGLVAHLAYGLGVAAPAELVWWLGRHGLPRPRVGPERRPRARTPPS